MMPKIARGVAGGGAGVDDRAPGGRTALVADDGCVGAYGASGADASRGAVAAFLDDMRGGVLRRRTWCCAAAGRARWRSWRRRGRLRCWCRCRRLRMTTRGRMRRCLRRRVRRRCCCRARCRRRRVCCRATGGGLLLRSGAARGDEQEGAWAGAAGCGEGDWGDGGSWCGRGWLGGGKERGLRVVLSAPWICNGTMLPMTAATV